MSRYQLSRRSFLSGVAGTAVRGRQGTITSAIAGKEAAEARISSLLPAEKASAEAALAQAQVELDKTLVRAGVSGRVEQFALRVGDVVKSLLHEQQFVINQLERYITA